MIFILFAWILFSQDPYKSLSEKAEETGRGVSVLSTISDMQWLVSKRLEDRFEMYFDDLNCKDGEITERELLILERKANAILESDALLEKIEMIEWDLYMEKITLDHKLYKLK